MSDPIVIIDTSRIHPGKLEDVKTAMTELVRFVEVNEPRVVAYDVCLEEDAVGLTVLQVHPDSASAEYHMDVAAPLFRRFAGLLALGEIHVYGAPSAELLSRLREKAALLGGAGVIVHPVHAGFARRVRPAAA